MVRAHHAQYWCLWRQFELKSNECNFFKSQMTKSKAAGAALLQAQLLHPLEETCTPNRRNYELCVLTLSSGSTGLGSRATPATGRTWGLRACSACLCSLCKCKCDHCTPAHSCNQYNESSSPVTQAGNGDIAVRNCLPGRALPSSSTSASCVGPVIVRACQNKL